MTEEYKKDEEISMDEQESSDEEFFEGEDSKNRKIKNLTSAIILISGLFVGSLFVDIIQLVRGGGYSQQALNKTDVFASGGKTWVAFNQPIVKMMVVNDETCGEACKPDEVLVGLKEVLPTMLTQKVDVNSKEGKQYVSQFDLKTLPAFIFSKEIEKTDLFAKAQQFMDKNGDYYAIKSLESGFPVGKYIHQPQVDDSDIRFSVGKDATLKVILYTDFQCPFCKQLHEQVVKQLVSDYGDKIDFVFKNFPLPIHPLANSAALAGECANEQGKFSDYADKLFAEQANWGKQKDAGSLFKGYARQLGMDQEKFSQCYDAKKFQSHIDASVKQAEEFGLQGTPSLFIGSEFESGQVMYDNVKQSIEKQLGK